jgi:hypothetical protein
MRLKIEVPEGIDVMNLRLSSAEKERLKNAGLKAASAFMKLEALDAYAVESKRRVSSSIDFARRLYVPQRLVVPLLRTCCEEIQRDFRVENPRASIFLQVSNSTRSNVYYYGFDDSDKDVNLPLPNNTGIVGIAWNMKDLVVGVMPNQGIAPELLESPLEYLQMKTDWGALRDFASRWADTFSKLLE